MLYCLCFCAGWFGAADLQKAFGPEAQGSNVKDAALKAAQIWAIGIPVIIVHMQTSEVTKADGIVAIPLVVLQQWHAYLNAMCPTEIWCQLNLSNVLHQAVMKSSEAPSSLSLYLNNVSRRYW